MAELTLTRASLRAIDAPPRQHCWPLEVTAVSTYGDLDSHIFVYHAGIGFDPGSAIPGSVFECVASLPQLQEIPVNNIGEDPITGDPVPFYRSDTLLFYCRSAVEAESLWEKIEVDVRALVANYLAAQVLEDIEVVVIS